jgi:hypothetical protein
VIILIIMTMMSTSQHHSMTDQLAEPAIVI